jgi:excisionase family DNA binding protein
MKTLNYQEAADFLKISPGTLRNWVSQGRIKPHKIGGRVLFFREELETWITTSEPAAVKKPTVETRFNASLNNTPPQNNAPAPWQPKLNVTFSEQNKDPYALLLNLPGPNVKMTPDNMRELARYLVDAANFCEKKEMRGLENFPIMRENERCKSSVVLVPFNQMRDLQTLALAAKRAGDVLATTKEKYVVQFIKDGLKHQLPLINMQLKKKGLRRISLKSLKK